MNTNDERSITIEVLEAKAKEVEGQADVAKTEDDLRKGKESVEELRRLLREGVEWWAQFDVRRGQELVEHMERVIDGAQSRLRPRRRFKFKSASKSTTTTSNTKTPYKTGTQQDSAEGEGDQAGVALVEIKVSDFYKEKEQGDVLTVRQNKIERRGVKITEGEGRRIVVEQGSRSLWLVSLSNCVVDISDVDGPLWVRDCQHSVIRCKCRQLRVHQCHSCVFRICVVGAPVLENCTDMRIGPLKGVKPQSDATSKDSMKPEKETDGRWGDVVDMSWLREGESTNWRFVTDDDDDESVLSGQSASVA